MYQTREYVPTTPFPPYRERISTRFLPGYQREDRTFIFCDGLHVLTVIGADGGVSVFAVDADSTRLTHVTSRMPDHVTTHAEAVTFWTDELAFHVEAVAI